MQNFRKCYPICEKFALQKIHTIQYIFCNACFSPYFKVPYYRVFLLLSVCFRVIICDRICEKGPHAMIIVFVEIGDKH